MDGLGEVRPGTRQTDLRAHLASGGGSLETFVFELLILTDFHDMGRMTSIYFLSFELMISTHIFFIVDLIVTLNV